MRASGWALYLVTWVKALPGEFGVEVSVFPLDLSKGGEQDHSKSGD